MQKERVQLLVALGFAALAGGCATMSTTSRIESELRALGLSNSRAECLARDLDDHLGRDDLRSVANFLEDLNQSGSPGDALSALLSIDNPRVAAAMTRSSATCALDR